MKVKRTPQTAMPVLTGPERRTSAVKGAAADVRPAPNRKQVGRARGAWVLMTPGLALLLLMTIVPAGYILWASLHNSTLLGGGSRFVGLSNYTQAVTDPDQRHAFLVTIAFVAIAVTIELLLGLLLSLPLAAQSRANNVATAILLLPFAVTPVVSALIFREMLNPNYGWVDWFLGLLHLPSHIDWLGHANTAWIALVGLDVWQWTPFVALILMAGLQAVPHEPLEAAAVDGASRFQTFRYVTLPLLTPFIAIAVVLRTIQAFKTFDSFQVLTGGGPGAATENLNLDIYRVALQSFRIGAASATAMLFLILLSLLVPVLLRVVGRGADPEDVTA